MQLKSKTVLKFPDNLEAAEDLSAIASINTHLIMGGDEGHVVELLKVDCENTYTVQTSLTLVNDPKTETDIEDICCMGSTCYVIGSHSRKRKKVKPDKKSQADNRDRLYKTPTPQPTREVLVQLTLNPETKQLSIQKKGSLSDIIQSDPLLRQFVQLPSKENGIDIEGLAIKGDRLFVGFRSPILRGNYVPILTVDANSLSQPKLKFIQMGGRGVRAMTETAEGFLIIGGPPGDGEMNYQLYFWHGNDMIPGNDIKAVHPLHQLGQIPVPEGTKAEGLALLSETDHQWQVLIVYDGVAGGNPTIYEINK